MSIKGYAKQQNMAMENASPAQTLAWGLTTTARRMAAAKDVADSGMQAGADQPGTTAKDMILEAVRLNWRLWTIIQTEQADPDCSTPKGIREGLLNLSNFVDKRSLDILAQPLAEKLEILISINRNIAAGLLGLDNQPEAGGAEPEAMLQAG